MRTRLLAARTLMAAMMLVSFAAGRPAIGVSADTQAPAAPVKPIASKAARAETWKTPRTPWGDPDLRGVFSNGDEYTTPLERPDR